MKKTVSLAKKCFCLKNKSCMRYTPTLSTNADSRNNTNLKRLGNLFNKLLFTGFSPFQRFQHFFSGFSTFQRFLFFLAFWHLLAVLALFSGCSTFQRFQHFFLLQFQHFLAVLALFSNFSTFNQYQHFLAILALFSGFSTLSYYRHRSRELVSSVCGFFYVEVLKQTKQCVTNLIFCTVPILNIPTLIFTKHPIPLLYCYLFLPFHNCGPPPIHQSGPPVAGCSAEPWAGFLLLPLLSRDRDSAE